MASSRKMLIEILDYRRFISGDSVSQPQCSGQLGVGALILYGLYSTLSQNFLEFVLQYAHFCLKKLVFAFLINCQCILVPNLPERFAGTIWCYCITPQDDFVLVRGIQVWSEPRAISVPSSTFFERGMLIYDGEKITLKKRPGILD